MSKQDVDSLVGDALEGNPEAWTTIVENYSGLVWSIIRSLAISEPDDSDVFQTVFLRLTENLGRVTPAALPGWLATVTRRACYDVARSRKRNPIPTEEVDIREELEVDLEGMVVLGEEHAAVLAGFNRLTENCKQLLRLLSSTVEFSYTHISEVLDIPIGSIGPTRARCLEKLAQTPEIQGLDIKQTGRS